MSKSVNIQPEEMRIQLEMKDRLNYPYIITTSLLALEKAYSQDDFDLEKVENLIRGLFAKIPESWKDDDFNDDLKNVIQKRLIDVRPSFGDVKLSKKYCEQHYIIMYQETTSINYLRLKRAIINLLDRRGMLVRRDKIEFSTGKNLDENPEDYEFKDEEEIEEK